MKLLVLVLMLAMLCGTASAWLTGYDHRMAIEINNSGNNLSYYQYNITVDTAALVASGNMTYANGSDCRITDVNDNLLSFWNQTDFNTTTTKICINATSLGNISNETHYMYYGKTGVDSVSDGDATFEFFDDFDYAPIPSYEIYDGSREWATGGIEMPNGTIIAAWEHGSGSKTNDKLIRASQSTDGGATWGSMYTLQDTAGLADCEAQFLVIGSIVYFYYTTIDESHADRPMNIYHKTSTNNGSSWSTATEITYGSGEMVTSQNPIIKKHLPNAGRIILPIYGWNGSGTNWYSSVVYSDNNCSTWTRGGNTEISANAYSEPSVIEKANGHIIMQVRRYGSPTGYIFQTESSDSGDTWGAMNQTSLQTPNTQSAAIELENGHFVVLGHDSQAASGTPLSLGRSTDNGATWAYERDIKTGSGDWGNLGILLKSNDEIVALYTDQTAWSIHSAIFDEDDILAPSLSDKWDASGTVTVANGAVVGKISSKSTFGTGYAVRVRAKNANDNKYFCNWADAIAMSKYISYRSNAAHNNNWTTEKYNGGIDWSDTNVLADNTNYNVYDIGKYGTTGYFTRDGTDDGTLASCPTTLANKVTQYNDDTYWDWALVRKYTSPEPTASLGAEESTPWLSGIYDNISCTIYPNGSIYSAQSTSGHSLQNLTISPTIALTINVTTLTEPLKYWNESASSDTYALYTVGAGDANTTYVVNVFADVNSTKMQTFRIKANATGYIKYNATGYGYDRWTDITPATEPPGTLVIISVCGAVLIAGGWAIRRWVKKN